MAETRGRGRGGGTMAPATDERRRFEGEVYRAVMVDLEVAILRRPEGDPAFGADWRSSGLDLMAAGWLLIAMRDDHWYSVEYSGRLEGAADLARELAAPRVASHEMRTAFEPGTGDIASESAKAAGKTRRDERLLNVLWVPDGSPFVVGNRHGLTLDPSAVHRTGNAGTAASHGLGGRVASEDTPELPSRRY